MSLANNPDEQPTQAFQSLSTGDVVHIPTRTDSKTGKYFILWRDILCVFENAKFIRNGASLVLFMTDEDFNLLDPPRIPYHPGFVLDVIGGNNPDSSTSTKSKSKNSADSSSAEHHNTSTSAELLAAYEFTNTDTDNQPLTRGNNGASEGSQSSPRMNSQVYFQIISGQKADIMQFMDEKFDELNQIERAEKKLLQEQLLQLQEHSDQKQQKTLQLLERTRREVLEKQQQLETLQKDLTDRVIEHQIDIQLHQQKMHAELMKKQEEVLQSQTNAISWLAVLQQGLQALLTQTYELHEYPIPRLFIVLPKVARRRDRLNLLSESYRLYFLCECGTHTMAKHSESPPAIHLAKHEGYDLERPTEFFEKYGSYLLAMLRIVRLGVTAASLVVPPLETLKILDGLDSAQEYVHMLRDNIVPLVDDTIEALQDFAGNNDANTEWVAGSAEIEALEGADLRQLEQFLKTNDQGRAHGNLYRIVTPEGHVKWVCFDHYSANYRESETQKLQVIVEANGGSFIEETGRIEIKIGSKVLAKHLYDAMVKARGIQELDITLGWDATMSDLQSLAKAVSKANIIRLSVHVYRFKKSPSDVFQRGRRYDSLLRLASNGRIQELELNGLDDLFSHVSNSSLVPASKLRVFSAGMAIPFGENACKAFREFIKQRQSPTTIELKLRHQHSIETVLADLFGGPCNLEQSRVVDTDQSLIINASKGEILRLTLRNNADQAGGEVELPIKDMLSANWLCGNESLNHEGSPRSPHNAVQGNSARCDRDYDMSPRKERAFKLWRKWGKRKVSND
ncbi:hypothetical protein BGZ65_008651 [Modicella reniformis]|uniref:Uncharacterized protein n=1 Tax=Modicella reniformis TaxID=1440133 RepID=A0A9P6J6U1_9FUNG|nr:hypothetical protein BGZ65_008651 [Modicella reniformis]